MNNTYNGIMNVYKERGFTSHDVVAKLRGICHMKKIGHTGTLDPEAVGVLPVCLGSGTKLCDMLTDWDKEYIAVLRLGVVTDTQDMSGKILERCDAGKLRAVTQEQVRETIMGFLGDYDQIPPMYSALKVDGKKLYELARAGKEVERKPRRVRVKEIEICESKLPTVRMRVVCSKGTYIRTLCHDIGAKLGCGGAMESLVRSRVGIFGMEEALTLSALEKLRDEGEISDVIIPPDAVFAQNRSVCVNEQGLKMAQNGNRLGTAQLKQTLQSLELADGEQVRVYDEEKRFYGIYAFYAAERLLKPVKMFLE
ncbi:MAG: tRNA pseudouridine(55) synthase TruB [Lachnospiraceae bacterium]|nr:tRNA pseudouridine(55) synthase TruB [Lachnospiraceae bacterium]